MAMPWSRAAAARMSARETSVGWWSVIGGCAWRSTPASASGRPGAVDAERRPGDRLEPLGGDRVVTRGAGAVRPGAEPRQRVVDLLQLELRAIAEGKVALLLEDVRRGGRLRAVGHLARPFDRLREERGEAAALGVERGTDDVEIDRTGHGRIVRRGPHARRPERPDLRAVGYTPWEY